MNDDIVVQKILKLLENNTAFIGYALNGGIGTKINVRNTETGKTIQAESVNVDSSGEVLVVKDSNDGKYKAVTFRAGEQTIERIIQIRKTKPVDDKKIIDYTDSDIEVFYLFVKLIDTGSPVDTQLQSTWIRKGSSCTQFVGAYERCNYASKATIGGTSYTGLPYVPYSTLQDCLNDDLGRDAKTPHGTGDEQGGNAGWKYFSTQVSASGEEAMRAALESHDAHYNTSYKKLFGYASIIECSGAMTLQGWEAVQSLNTITNETEYFFRCEFSYLPGYTTDCTPAMQAAGYCDTRGFISSKCPQYGQEAPGQPGIGNIDSSWNSIYGWKDLPYEFMYKRHFGQLYLNGSTAPGSYYILEVNDDQVPGNLPSGYSPWIPGCPSNLGDGGPYDGGGGNRNPDGPPKVKKRDMKLSTHKAEIWLGSSKKEEAIKLYELGASDLFSGMYNSFIIRANETQVDIENRLKRGFTPSQDDVFIDEKFYENRDRNRIDLNINPKVWVYVVDNVPKAFNQNAFDNYFTDPTNATLNRAINNLYNKTISLSIIDNRTQVIHLKLGLTSRSALSNTDCKGVSNSSYGLRDLTRIMNSQSWEYQKYVTITVKNWGVQSTTNSLDTTLLESEDTWNTDYIKRKFYTSFGGFDTNQSFRDTTDQILLRHDANTNIEKIVTDNYFEQFNYSLKFLVPSQNYRGGNLYFSGLKVIPTSTFYDDFRYYALSSRSWWELWGKGIYSKKTKRLSSIVGYEKNYYQIVRNFGTGANLSYGLNGIGNVLYNESFFDYLNTRPKVFVPSVIKFLRTDSTKTYYYTLKDRKKILEQIGTLFYFAETRSRWSELTNTPLFLTLPSSYYSQGYTGETLTHYNPLQSNLRNDNTFLRIMDTRQWLQNLWAQLVYDGTITVDIDSYKDVIFTSPTDPTKYKKFALVEEGINSNYPFSTAVNNSKPPVELETVLSPGVLDVTKQVPIKKPINVELDPNMSFLLYIYPFCTVTKKKKEI